jgi:LuxR family maltose regulon positive regulatory protein
MQETATRLNGAGYLYNHINSLDPHGSSLLKSNVGYWGAIDQSIAVYGYAEPLWSGVNQGYGIIHTVLGECYYERNQMNEAEKSLLTGRRVGLDLLDAGIILPASLTLVQLKRARGEHQAAQIFLDETRKLLANEFGDSGVFVLDACQVRLHIQADQHGPVRKWFRRQSPDAYGVLDIRYVYEYLTLLRVYAFLGHFRHGIAFGERLLQFSQTWYLHYYIAEIHLLLAILYAGDGDRNTAFHRLDSAMEIALKEGYVQLFLAEWKPAEQLLDKYGKHIRLKKTKAAQEILTFYNQLIQYRNEQELSADKDRFVQKQLTAKEYKVLQALIAGKSNAVIADELSVKLETVKTHCKNIYKKLHLKSRKAVLRHFSDT